LQDALIEAPFGVPAANVLDEISGDAHFVLIGESSHGTHEFYAARAAITRWLITEKGFDAVAAEADWPDAYRVDRCVRGEDHDSSRVPNARATSPCFESDWSSGLPRSGSPEPVKQEVLATWACR
jgi:erythromycin esterase-like protein